MNNTHRLLYTLCVLFYAHFLYAQFSVIDPISPPAIPLNECKQRLLQSFDEDTYDSFVRHGATQQNMYYYIYVATNFSYNTTLLYYPANDIALIYNHCLTQMDNLSINVYFEILQEGNHHSEPWCIRSLGQLYGMVYQDTITALNYYQHYLQLDMPQEKHQRSVDIFLEYLINPSLSCKGKIIRPKNTFKPGTLDEWRYHIFWEGDTSSYEQLLTWARQSGNTFDFYECMYYSLVMAGKYAYEPAREDLRKILGTMITDDTPDDALARRLLHLL